MLVAPPLPAPIFPRVFHRSLAALAGERDRALRSLAAEEDKRHDLIEDLSTALGDELSCANLSRLVIGLEKIEQEQERSVDEKREEEEPYGRSWVLEVSRVSWVPLSNIHAMSDITLPELRSADPPEWREARKPAHVRILACGPRPDSLLSSIPRESPADNPMTSNSNGSD